MYVNNSHRNILNRKGGLDHPCREGVALVSILCTDTSLLAVHEAVGHGHSPLNLLKVCGMGIRALGLGLCLRLLNVVVHRLTRHRHVVEATVGALHHLGALHLGLDVHELIVGYCARCCW